MTPELLASTQTLSLARRAAVFAAHDAWIESGLEPALAARHAVRLAARIRGKHLERVRREVRVVSRAAERHEQSLMRVFAQATQAAQDALGLAKLEARLTLGEAPWDLLEPVVARLGASLG